MFFKFYNQSISSFENIDTGANTKEMAGNSLLFFLKKSSEWLNYFGRLCKYFDEFLKKEG